MYKHLCDLDPWTLPRVPLAQKSGLPKDEQGLYFVFQNSQILYVGKTETSFHARWNSGNGHHREYELSLTGDIEIAWLGMSLSSQDLHLAEKMAMQLFHPSMNGTRCIKKPGHNSEESKGKQRSVSLPDRANSQILEVAEYVDLPPATVIRNALISWWGSEEFSLLLKRAREKSQNNEYPKTTPNR